jgi:hypothetical protein
LELYNALLHYCIALDNILLKRTYFDLRIFQVSKLYPFHDLEYFFVEVTQGPVCRMPTTNENILLASWLQKLDLYIKK